MKALLLSLAAYNQWANQTIMDRLVLLPDEVCSKPVQSSFGSIFKTVEHMNNAETIWWQRIQASGTMQLLKTAFDGSMQQLADAFTNQNKQWLQWISKASDNEFKKIVHYQNTSGQPFEQPVFEILLHVFNHATYHRGQLITMLRALQVNNLPPTDFIVWSRLINK